MIFQLNLMMFERASCEVRNVWLSVFNSSCNCSVGLRSGGLCRKIHNSQHCLVFFFSQLHGFFRCVWVSLSISTKHKPEGAAWPGGTECYSSSVWVESYCCRYPIPEKAKHPQTWQHRAPPLVWYTVVSFSPGWHGYARFWLWFWSPQATGHVRLTRRGGKTYKPTSADVSVADFMLHLQYRVVVVFF